MIDLENKKILVTGASSGIGRQIAIELSKSNSRVVLISRSEERLTETISLMQNPNLHKYFVYDLQNIDGIKDLIERCVKFDGMPFAGVAGVAGVMPLKILDYKSFKTLFDINTYSMIEIIKHVSKAKNSIDATSIIYISTVATKFFEKGQMPYILSKGGFDAIVKPLSLELIKRKIRINTLLAGDVDTNMLKSDDYYRQLKDKSSREIFKTPQTLKILSPKDVANMALFLLSDVSKYIIGENYFIDAGSFR